jgi:AcrR family transcriptional regulator
MRMKPMPTHERILDAAESLFASRGYSNTSMRQITTAAGANLAAINYHFGTKLALFSAVLSRRILPVNQDRLDQLARLEKTADGPPELESVLHAFLDPVFQRSLALEDQDRMRSFLRLVHRAHSHEDPTIRATLLSLFQEVFDRFNAAFMEALPGASPEEVRIKMFFVLGAMMQTLAWCHRPEWFSPDAAPAPRLEGLLTRLVRFCAAGMRAPAPNPREREMV